jgi:hypothetical protein
MYSASDNAALYSAVVNNLKKYGELDGEILDDDFIGWWIFFLNLDWN